MSGSYAYTVKQPNAIRCKVEDISRFDINDFIELFLPNGPLNQYSKSVFGITTFNYASKVFTLTFNPEIATAITNEFLNLFSDGKKVKMVNGAEITLFARRPPPPTETVTLYPMPHGATGELLTKISSTWGTLKSFEYGRHKLLPLIRNSYLHLKIAEINYAKIPERIIVNQHYVAVMKPGENITFRCGFCKLKGHKTNECHEKRQPKHKQENPTRKAWNNVQHTKTHSLVSCEQFPSLSDPVNTNSNPKVGPTQDSQLIISSSIANLDTECDARSATNESDEKSNTTSPAESLIPPNDNVTAPNITTTENITTCQTLEEKHDAEKPQHAYQIHSVPLSRLDSNQNLIEDVNTTHTTYDDKNVTNSSSTFSIFDIPETNDATDSDSLPEDSKITQLQHTGNSFSDTPSSNHSMSLTNTRTQLNTDISLLFGQRTEVGHTHSNSIDVFPSQSPTPSDNLLLDSANSINEKHDKWQKVQKKRLRDSSSPSGITPPQKSVSKPRNGSKKSNKPRKHSIPLK